MAAVPPGPNPDLVAVHRSLVTLVQGLDAAIGRARDAAEVTAILDGIAEVNARVTSVGRQLFTRQTADVAALAGQVAAAVPEVEQAIERLEGVRGLVDGMTSLLGVVDRLVGVARLVA